jgi:hypothetical protein
MLTRSATMNKIADAIDGLLLIAEISSSHAILRRSSSVSVSSKLESLHPTVGPAWSDFSPQDPLEPPPSPTRLPLRSSSSFAPSAARSRTKKAPKGVYGIRPDYIVSGDRETRIRDIKRRALNIPSTGNTPATEQQRLVMLMVFKEITPYPDEGWLSILAILVDRWASFHAMVY